MRTGLRELLAGILLILAVPASAAGKTADEKPASPKGDQGNTSAAQGTAPGTQPRTVPRAGSRSGRRPGASSSSTGAQPARPSASGTTPSSRRQQAASRQPTASRGSEPGTHVYTNEDLRKYARPEDKAIDEDEAQKAREQQEGFETDALKRQRQQPAGEAYRARLRKEAEDAVSSAEKRLVELRQRAEAVANPLLPQPELTPEEKEKWKTASRAELYAKTQHEIKDAEDDLAAARFHLQEVLKSLSSAR